LELMKKDMCHTEDLKNLKNFSLEGIRTKIERRRRRTNGKGVGEPLLMVLEGINTIEYVYCECLLMIAGDRHKTCVIEDMR